MTCVFFVNLNFVSGFPTRHETTQTPAVVSGDGTAEMTRSSKHSCTQNTRPRHPTCNASFPKRGALTPHLQCLRVLLPDKHAKPRIVPHGHQRWHVSNFSLLLDEVLAVGLYTCCSKESACPPTSESRHTRSNWRTPHNDEEFSELPLFILLPLLPSAFLCGDLPVNQPSPTLQRSRPPKSSPLQPGSPAPQ